MESSIRVEHSVHSSIVAFCAVLSAIGCLISGVMLCGRLWTFTVEREVPSAVIPVYEEVTEEVNLEPEVSESPSGGLVVMHPGFQTVDEKQIWTTETSIDIFKVTYDGTVDGVVNKVIAPGTTNSYYFELQNIGDVAVDFEMNMEAYISDNVDYLPVEVRVSDYTGRYLCGSENSWENVEALNNVNDAGSLSEGYRTKYMVTWQWPFEGDDEFDTMLGNLAVKEDVTLTIVINTKAEANVSSTGGFQTGDDSHVSYLFGSMVASLSIFIFLMSLYRKEEKKNEA